jgi:hypothetical protein
MSGTSLSGMKTPCDSKIVGKFTERFSNVTGVSSRRTGIIPRLALHFWIMSQVLIIEVGTPPGAARWNPASFAVSLF